MTGQFSYGPPRIDFTPLANLGKTFFDARDKARKQADEEAGYAAFDRMLRGRPAPDGSTSPALQSPQDLTRGVPLPALGKGFGTPAANIDRNTVHVAETEDDVQRLERATGMNVAPDLDKVVRTVYGEAAREGPAGQAAVAGVIANRARQSGMTPTDVVLAKDQFEPWNDPAARARMESLDPNSPEYQRIAATVRPVLEGNAPDPTGGADHFYSPGAQAKLGRNAPSWDDGSGRDIGNHRFFSHGYRPRGPVQVAQADIPNAGAANAQGFIIPGQAPAQAGLPSDTAGSVGQGFTPQEATELRAMYRSESTRPLALAIVQQRMGSKTPYNFTTVNGQLVRTRSDTGTAEVIPGIGGQQYRALTDPADRARYGIPENDTRPYQVGPDGKLTAPPGGTTVNVDAGQKGQNKFEETLGAKQAERWNGYITAADEAQTRKADIDQMRELSRRIGSQGSTANGKLLFGPFFEAAGIDVPGLPDLQAYDSLVKRLAPQMRAPGSGSTSDVEYKGFIAAIGPLSNHPAAREAILDTFEAAARNDLARGEIATRLATGEISRGQAEKELRALPSPLQAFREFRKVNPGLVGQAIKEGRIGGSKPNPGAPAPKKLGDVPIPGDAVRDLRAMPDTPQTRAQFDEAFGVGAAERILGKAR